VKTGGFLSFNHQQPLELAVVRRYMEDSTKTRTKEYRPCTWWLFIHTDTGWVMEGDYFSFNTALSCASDVAKEHLYQCPSESIRVKLFSPETGEVAEGTMVVEEPRMEWD